MADVCFQFGPFYRYYQNATSSGGASGAQDIQVGIPSSTNANLYTGALAAGDVKISKDGGAEVNVATLPTQIGATGVWAFRLSASELTAQTVTLHVKKAGSTAEIVITIETRSFIQGPLMYGLNTCTGGGTSTITLDASASAVDNFYNEATIILAFGTGSGQARNITGYVGATKVATVGRPWSTVPVGANTQFVIYPGPDGWDQLEQLPAGELSGARPDNATFRQNLSYLARRFFNKVTQTSAVQTVMKADSATALTTMTVSDDGTTQTKAKGL